MENNLNNTRNWEIHKESPTGRILGGIIVIGVGIILLLRTIGVLFPSWLFTWQMLVIVIGLYSGAKRSFNGLGWLIPVAIGSFFLVTEFFGWPIKQFFWPAFLIIIGSIMILKPKRKKKYSCEQRYTKYQDVTNQNISSDSYGHSQTINDETIEVNCIFGGAKRIVNTKSFKGGEVNAIFGGAEIDFRQADFSQTIVLEVNAIFGGVKMIVPPHWKIDSEATVILGGLDDKRINENVVYDENKKLIIKGVAAFGGIDIRSY